MELKQNEVFVLKVCEEEPGNTKEIADVLNFPEKKVQEILLNLKKKKLVYLDRKIKGGLYATTLLGMKEFYAVFAKRKTRDL